ncbi:hypothetical protein D9619_012101 [Psilocybe cf. subviscida]|uniref:non-specific serine/threonine protein kinase n=1 Tax=Psilocybe cf. subviscida TaxID=2480587 RepID=A0A8H5B7G6_9AGAR|nr:hypothetical protein D9619_012101 [Psilocybe cf. subviscida]
MTTNLGATFVNKIDNYAQPHPLSFYRRKRSWDGAENEGNSKRLRDRDDAKDWRDLGMTADEGHRGTTVVESQIIDLRTTVGATTAAETTEEIEGGVQNPRLDVHVAAQGVLQRREKRESESTGQLISLSPETHSSYRISPRASPSSLDSRHDEKTEEKREEKTQEKAPSPPPPPVVDMEIDLPHSPPPVEDMLAARRAKREAIRLKHLGIDSVNTSVSPSPGPSSAVQPLPTRLHISNPVSQNFHTEQVSEQPPGSEGRSSISVAVRERESASASPTPRDFTLAKENGSSDQPAESAGDEQVLAADYDPSLDRREDERKRFGVKDKPNDIQMIDDDEDEEIEVEEEEGDDIDDMFAVALADKPKKKTVKKVKKAAVPALITTATLDTASDPEGYYSVILGEQLDGGKYQVFSSLGKGMFANVVRARILQGEPGEVGREVAIKIIRCQESMYRAGLKEVQILNKLKQADPEDKKHIVRLERTFEHRGHLCLVFESMSMNLRDVVKRFGKDIGLNIRAVRAYAKQLFLALSLLRKTNIMHADIKPDNILVNEQKTVLKLCDLGSASDASENDITPYLVSRFYRAPEIILGVPYDPSLDIWSIGCTLYELYTGKILFPGRSNNQMLLFMMELKGRFNTKMIKKAKFGDVYFDEMGGFESVEKDRVTGSDVFRKVHITKPTRDLRARLMPRTSVGIDDEENKTLGHFIDLLDKCLSLDPQRRITPREALLHPFLHV